MIHKNAVSMHKIRGILNTVVKHGDAIGGCMGQHDLAKIILFHHPLGIRVAV